MLQPVRVAVTVNRCSLSSLEVVHSASSGVHGLCCPRINKVTFPVATLLVGPVEITLFPQRVQQHARSLTRSGWSITAVLAADVDDLSEGALVEDGFGVLRVALAQVVQDVTQSRRHLGGQVGAGVVVG